MNHRINNLTQLYEDSRTLYNTHIISGDADTIIYNLERGIAILKDS